MIESVACLRRWEQQGGAWGRHMHAVSITPKTGVQSNVLSVTNWA